MHATEIKDNEPVHIMHGSKLWERGTAISYVDIDGSEWVIVRVNGYADNAYELDTFTRNPDGVLRTYL